MRSPINPLRKYSYYFLFQSESPKKLSLRNEVMDSFFLFLLLTDTLLNLLDKIIFMGSRHLERENSFPVSMSQGEIPQVEL